jgi:hypothetical protein
MRAKKDGPGVSFELSALKNAMWQEVLISKDTTTPGVSADKEQKRLVNLVKNTKYVCISPSARQDRFNVAPALITTP